ncbi:MAG TPA: hypothetical protein VGD62_12840 [Acidobacteriaceae bacterium]
MLGSVVLDVAIGMVFVFLLLSLIASAVQELLATIVQARPANLLRGILSLFSGGTLDGSLMFVKGIYQHGLVQGLYRDDVGDFAKAPPGPAKAGTDQAPAGPAALASLPMRKRTFLQRMMRMADLPDFDWVKNVALLPAYIPSRTFSLALLDLLNPEKKTGGEMVGAVRAYLVAAKKRQPEDKAVEALLALSVDAGDSLAKLQSNVENWYNDAMDRASGWYKKNTQYILLGIGLTLAVAFNVNSISVGQALWFDRDVRESMVDAAKKIHQQDSAPANGDAASIETRLQANIKAFQDVSGPLLPVGWTRPTPSVPNGWSRPGWLLWHGVAVGIGWLITAVAISLGAPFWFDILNKIMVVRGTVKPQEKSRNEGSKDPTPQPLTAPVRAAE